MVYNEQCKFTSALITLNGDELKALLKNRYIDIQSDEELDKLIGFIRDDLTAFSKKAEYAGIPAQWRPASFAIIPGVFDETNGLVNSTMKLVRHKVREVYRSRIDELYANHAADPCVPGNRSALKTILEK
jgi:long-chain acyl-CoA synthetase